MDSDVLSRLLNPVTQTERRHPHRFQSRTLFDQFNLNCVKWHIHQSLFKAGCQSAILFSSFLTYNICFDCKLITRAAPLMFAVNIETNGNPHHRPWSIGKRLLSSWLPVRSAKDQGGGKGHTHIVRWKPRPNGTGSHLSQSSLASMDSASARNWTLSNWNIKDFC